MHIEYPNIPPRHCYAREAMRAEGSLCAECVHIRDDCEDINKKTVDMVVIECSGFNQIGE